MIAYHFGADYGLEIFSYIRIVFKHGLETIPAINCTDFFADEIAAEADGRSNSTFYTDTYVTG